MTFEIASILAVDGIATGAIYTLVAIGVVLIFAVTRVIFIPFGDIAAFTALTLAAIERGQVPGTIGMVIALAVVAALIEVGSLVQSEKARMIPRALFWYLGVPLLIVGATRFALSFEIPPLAQIFVSLLVMMPVAPLLDRIVFRPIADASVLLLLIVAMALHFALVGIGLLFFGPEGVRTQPLVSQIYEVGPILISGQTLIIVAAAIILSACLYLFFDVTLTGKALRATASNRTGARLMGIKPEHSGSLAYIVGSLLAGVSGVLIAPVNTMFYDSGFLLGLKAFVGAIIGGMMSYPGAAIGAFLVGILESFASFQSSSFKDVLVFSLLIPILLWRSIRSRHIEEEPEE